MSVLPFVLPPWEEWVLTLALALGTVSAGLAASAPWLIARLDLQGRRGGRERDREAARILGEGIFYNAVLAILLAALGLLHFSFLQPRAFYTAAILLHRALLALLPLMAIYVGLAALHRWAARREEFPLLRLAAALGAGLAAAPVLLVGVGFAVAVADSTWWPRLGSEPWAVFAHRAALHRLAHLYLVAFEVGGIALMLIGRRAFRWESGIPVSEGARHIRLGALVALVALLLQMGLAGGWVLWRGPGPLRGAIALGGIPFLVFLALAACAGIALLEVLVSIIRWRGSAPRASALAALLLSLLVLSAGAARSAARERPEAASARLALPAAAEARDPGGGAPSP